MLFTSLKLHVHNADRHFHKEGYYTNQYSKLIVYLHLRNTVHINSTPLETILHHISLATKCICGMVTLGGIHIIHV